MLKSIKKERIFDGLFFLSLILFLISVMIEATTFSSIPFFLRLSSYLRKGAWCLGGIKILLQGVFELQAGGKKLCWLHLAFFAVMGVCYYFCRSRLILHFCIFILAAKGISFKRIAKCVLFLQSGILAVTLLAYFTGFISGVDYTPPGEATCYSLGYNSPNCLMLIGFQLIMLYGYLRKERLRLFDYLLMGGAACLFYWPTQGRIGFACALLLLAALALYRKKWVQALLHSLRFLIKPFAALLCIGFLILTFLYPRPPMDTINRLSSDRLRLTSEAIDEFGITPFGQPIHWIGQRGKTNGPDSNYNYVDCSYAKALLDYGLIPLLFFLFVFYRQKDFLYKRKDYLMILFLLIIELYCFFESFWIPPIYNTTVFLMKDILYPLKGVNTDESGRADLS